MIVRPDHDDILKIRTLNAITKARAESAGSVVVDLTSGEVRIEPLGPTLGAMLDQMEAAKP